MSTKPAWAFGWRVFGLGMMALGLECLVFGDFLPGQPVPKYFPYRTVLAYVAGSLLLLAATAIEWHRTTAWGAATLTGYYTLLVLLLMNGRQLLSGYRVYGTYEGISMQLAIAASALIVFATAAQIDAQIGSALATRLTRIGNLTFGACALIWGGAHFIYMDMTAPLVPKWLPPGQSFWGYLSGICFIAAGLAILTGVKARLAAILLTIMIVLLGLLANGLTLLANPSSRGNWTESALNLALIGGAWVVADSFAQKGDSI